MPGGGGGASELLVPKVGMLKLPHPLSNKPAARTVKVTTGGDFGS
jgi:hypothetical protein